MKPTAFSPTPKLSDRVSFFPSHNDTQPQEMTWEQVVDNIRNNPIIELNTVAARAEYAAKGKTPYYKSLKNKSGCISPAAIQTGGRGTQFVTALTGVSLADFDDVSDLQRLAAMVSAVNADPHTFLSHITPGGHGLRVLFRYHSDAPQVSYRNAWQQGNDYYATLLDYPYDAATKNPDRLSYLCHDGAVCYRPEALPFKVVTAGDLRPQKLQNAPLGTRRGSCAAGEDDFEVAERIAAANGLQFMPGSRHNYLVYMAFLLNLRGVPQTYTLTHFEQHYGDYRDERLDALVASVYRRTDLHGKWEPRRLGRLASMAAPWEKRVRAQGAAPCGGKGSRTSSAAPLAAADGDDGVDVWAEAGADCGAAADFDPPAAEREGEGQGEGGRRSKSMARAAAIRDWIVKNTSLRYNEVTDRVEMLLPAEKEGDDKRAVAAEDQTRRAENRAEEGARHTVEIAACPAQSPADGAAPGGAVIAEVQTNLQTTPNNPAQTNLPTVPNPLETPETQTVLENSENPNLETPENPQTPNNSHSPFRLVPLTDRHINTLWARCDRDLNIRVRQQDFRDLINSHLIPTHNPFRAYFDTLPPHLPPADPIGDLARTVTVTPPEAQPFFESCFRKWFVSIVASLLHKNITNQVVLVLVGPQGIYKSTFFRSLLPECLHDYYLEKTNSARMDKDDKLSLCEFALICLEELDSLTDRDLNQLKALITTETVTERSPYARTKTPRPHIASFCATGNKTQFLTDTTGNRRWLPFEVRAIRSPLDHPIPHARLYAQALYLLNHHYHYWFDAADIARLAAHTAQFQEPSLEEELILHFFRKPDSARLEAPLRLSTSEIKTTLETLTRTPLSARKVSETMKRLGFANFHGAKYNGFIVARKTVEEIAASQAGVATE